MSFRSSSLKSFPLLSDFISASAKLIHLPAAVLGGTVFSLWNEIFNFKSVPLHNLRENHSSGCLMGEMISFNIVGISTLFHIFKAGMYAWIRIFKNRDYHTVSLCSTGMERTDEKWAQAFQNENFYIPRQKYFINFSHSTCTHM